MRISLQSMGCLVPTALLCLGALALAQDGQLQHHAVKPVSADASPVTESEARAVFQKTEGALRKALALSSHADSVSIPPGSAPVRRTQVVKEMARLYQLVGPKVKLTPMPVRFDPTVLRMSDPSAKSSLTMFVKMGAIGKVSPLATGPTDSLTVPQFGDAIGFFLARMAEITHLPSNRFTPELEPPPG